MYYDAGNVFKEQIWLKFFVFTLKFFLDILSISSVKLTQYENILIKLQ